MAEATERWSDRTLSQTKDGWQGTIAYDVVDAATEEDALNASGLPSIDDNHPVYGSLLRVVGRTPARKGLNLWLVTVTYSSQGENPLNQKAIITWGDQLTTEDVDRDADGNPILNSAHDPPTNGVQNEFYDDTLVIVQYEPLYDIRRSLAFRNTVNLDAFRLGAGGPTVNPGECLCTGIKPASQYEEGQTPLAIQYSFVFRPLVDAKLGISGFDYRFLDQGTRGFFTNSVGSHQPDTFYLPSNEPIGEPVRLRGNGIPCNTLVKVGRARKEPVAQTLPKGALLDNRFALDDALFLVYRKKLRSTFKGLLKFFQ